jgi:hypothetical protein
MNKTLENLLYCSGLTAQGGWDQLDEYQQQCVLKLVELTVLECVALVEPTDEHRRDASWGFLGGDEGVELLDLLVDKIKEHFGVES